MPDMTLTQQDLEQIRGVVRDEVRIIIDPLFTAVQLDIRRLDSRIHELDEKFVAEFRSVRQDLTELREQIRLLTTTMDGYVKRTDDWYQEFVILKARHDRLHQVLVEKGVVSDDELTLHR